MANSRSVNGSSAAFNGGNGGNHMNGNNHVPPPPPENAGIPLPPMPHTTVHPSEWTAEEQAILEENLSKYAHLPNISRYAKIAVLLRHKTVRDVALRCKWMNAHKYSDLYIFSCCKHGTQVRCRKCS